MADQRRRPPKNASGRNRPRTPGQNAAGTVTEFPQPSGASPRPERPSAVQPDGPSNKPIDAPGSAAGPAAARPGQPEHAGGRASPDFARTKPVELADDRSRPIRDARPGDGLRDESDTGGLREKADIDRGGLRDKVAAPDPSTVPLQTDAEAAGTPPDPAALRQAHTEQRSAALAAVEHLDPDRAVSTHDQDQEAPRRRSARAVLVMLAVVVVALALIAAVLLPYLR
jgi:hypothetical protein